MRVVEITVWPENSYGMTSRIGYGDFVYSFFSTVSYHLEGLGNWGKRFPRLLLDLCDHGIVENENLDELETELRTIYDSLNKMPLSDAVYDLEDLSKPMPNDLLPGDDDIVENLAQLWITPRGSRIYLDIFIEQICDAKRRNTSILLMYSPETTIKETMHNRKDKGRKYWLNMLPINYG